MTAWTRMDTPLVFMFMKSTGRCRPGICRMPPGHRRANSADAMIGGAQSFIATTALFNRQEKAREEEPGEGNASVLTVFKMARHRGRHEKYALGIKRWRKKRASGTEHTTTGGEGITGSIDKEASS